MSKVRSAALTTFFALFLLTLSLGIWQINRGYEKRELENTFSFQQHKQEILIAGVDEELCQCHTNIQSIFMLFCVKILILALE